VATGFLLARTLSRHRSLRYDGGEDPRCVQTTSATQTNCVHPHLVVFPAPGATFVAGIPHGLSGAVQRLTGGPEVFTTSVTASADTPSTLLSCSTVSRPGDTSVGVFFPRRRRAIEPLASPSPNLVHPPPRSPSRALRLRRMSFSRRGDPGRRMRCRPRPPIALPREKPRLVSIQDAFHRQGPFVGSGGLCVPGPATAAALLARRQPLDDDLSPPWACLPYPPRVSSEWARPATLFSPPDHARGFIRRRVQQARFLFTRPCRFF